MAEVSFTRRPSLILLCVLVTLCTASFDVSTQRGIDDVVKAGMACKHLTGLSLALVKNGKVVFSKGYGVKNKDTQEPVTPNTLFQIASLTKAFSSALLSHLLAQDPNRKMSTTLKASHTLPSSFQLNNTLLSEYATIADLLAHRTGVPRNSYMRLASNYSIDRLVDKLRYLPTAGGFRSSFFYNDMMYGLAARIAESLGHATWEQQIRDTFFRPLGMDNSTFISEVNFDTDDVATPYVVESGVWQKASIDFIKHWGRNTGSGNIFSSANDLSKWMLMLLNAGQDSNGRQVLRSRVLDEVFKAQNVVPQASYAASYERPVTPVSFSGDEYALGWKRGFYRGYPMAYHSGGTYAYSGFLTLLPEVNIGVVSLMTGYDSSYKLRTALHAYVMDLALGYNPWINSTTICTFPEPWKSAHQSRTRSDEEDVAEENDVTLKFHIERQRRAANTIVNPEAYAGTFQHGAYGDLSVWYNTSTQALQLQYGIGLWELQSADNRHFTGRWLKDYPAISAEFLFNSEESRIVSVTALTFDKSIPPVFFRKSGHTEDPIVG